MNRQIRGPTNRSTTRSTDRHGRAAANRPTNPIAAEITRTSPRAALLPAPHGPGLSRNRGCSARRAQRGGNCDGFPTGKSRYRGGSGVALDVQRATSFPNLIFCFTSLSWARARRSPNQWCPTSALITSVDVPTTILPACVDDTQQFCSQMRMPRKDSAHMSWRPHRFCSRT